MTDHLTRARQILAADPDHLTNPTTEQRHWLIAQLAAWPTRIDANKTTNDRFLRMSAVALLLEREAAVDPDVRRRLLSVCDTLENAHGQAFAINFHNLAADIRKVLDHG